jgi:hypothetical protein
VWSVSAAIQVSGREKNFQNESFEDTVYISANPHTTLLANNTFHELIEVWKEYDVSPNQIDPTEMVTIAKRANERYPNKRLIIHFMQPHVRGSSSLKQKIGLSCTAQLYLL